MNAKHMAGYALVTPARNEAANLNRLAASIAKQTLLPVAWVIVDNGSTDGTSGIAARLASQYEWASVISIPGEREATRGGPVARAFAIGVQYLPEVDVIVKLDADVSVEPDHFERLVERFLDDPSLGLASGTCYELDGGKWRPIYNSRDHVRGAVRAYRAACLADITPLEERMGWDSIDEMKAKIRGWTTTSFGDLPFFHHRVVGQRDGSLNAWRAQGDLAHYLSYRPSYLVFKTLFRSLTAPAAVAIFSGYGAAAIQRRPRYADADVRAALRREQRLREIPLRIREVRGKARKSNQEEFRASGPRPT